MDIIWTCDEQGLCLLAYGMQQVQCPYCSAWLADTPAYKHTYVGTFWHVNCATNHVKETGIQAENESGNSDRQDLVLVHKALTWGSAKTWMYGSQLDTLATAAAPVLLIQTQSVASVLGWRL